jgi:hypothetical protein
MRVVLDTDVMLSGLGSSTGASRVLLIAAWEGVIVPLTSVGMMIEYEAVLKRPVHLAEMGLRAEDIDAFSITGRLSWSLWRHTFCTGRPCETRTTRCSWT